VKKELDDQMLVLLLLIPASLAIRRKSGLSLALFPEPT
jgi:hypothetical protein